MFFMRHVPLLWQLIFNPHMAQPIMYQIETASNVSFVQKLPQRLHHDQSTQH